MSGEAYLVGNVPLPKSALHSSPKRSQWDPKGIEGDKTYVDKDVARTTGRNQRFGHARIDTSDPENLGCLSPKRQLISLNLRSDSPDLGSADVPAP